MNFLKNYFSTLSFIAWVYFFYSNIAYYQDFLSWNFSLAFAENIATSSQNVFEIVIALYVIFLIPFYLIYKEKSKARIIINLIFDFIFKQKKNIKQYEKTAILAWIVKAFFAPLMIFWLSEHSFNMLNNIYYSYKDIALFSTDFFAFFNRHFFWLAFTTILFFDVFLFTLWYLIEMPALKNKIKSVEPTVLWWLVALICYPPFNSGLTDIIDWYSTEFPQFANAYVHIGFNMTILILMGIYSWASISLGFKASNLTNRWIVRKWPYKYIRHPAYICKNLSWWIGWLPIIIAAILVLDFKTTLFALISLSGWSFIYYMRAITEERHLSLDPDYIEYKKKVTHKFIPKIW